MPSNRARSRFGLVLAFGLSLACTKTPTAEPTTDGPTNPDAEAARAFQVEHDRELRADEHSFLTVVESHYFPRGGSLELITEGATIHFASTDGQLVVSYSNLVQPIEERGVVELDPEGRFSLTVSKQETDWRVLVHDRDAPLRQSFAGIEWFPIDATLIVDAQFEFETPREPSVVQTSRGVTKTLYVAGNAKFELAGRPLELRAFAYSPDPVPDEPLLIPFRDETTGHESYTAGRYLEPTLPPGGQLRLDFNRATNPLCAYSEHYNCPVPPRYNTLPIAIRAGAKAPPPH